MSFRRILPAAVVLLLLVGGVVWSMSAGRLPPADFTFNNQTEIKTVDPALVSGQPEGRVINSLFEGLVSLSADDRMPITGGPEAWPGAAESWDISDDEKTYTFHIRKDAKWSNGDPVTAEDYHYSMRRFLSPITAAEYAKQGWYLVNGKKFNAAGTYLEPGDSVEVELNLEPGEHETKIGKLIKGKLIRKDPEKMPKDPKERDKITQRYYVDVDGKEECYVVGRPGIDKIPEGTKPCRLVTFDFDEVGIRVVDDHTLEMELENPTPFWLQLMGFYPLFPVHRGCLEKYGAPDWTRPENIVTNGPYRIGFRRPRDRVRLVKNENYWNKDNIALETIDALCVEKGTTSLNMYMLGDVDWIPEPPTNLIRELMESDPPRDDFMPAPQLGTYYYKLNVKRGPLADNRVRQALSLALDRDEIIRTAVRGPQEPANSLVPPGVIGYTPATQPPADPEKARKLLAEAGYPGGSGFPSLEILYNTHEAHTAVAELVRKQWQRELGIAVTLRNEAWPAYQDRLRMSKYDVGRQAWIADYNDANTFLDLYVSDNENNQTNWANAEYDKLIKEAESEADEQKRSELLHRAEVILMAEGPIVPIYYYYSRNMVKPHVRGFYNNLQDIHPLHMLSIDRDSDSPNEFMQEATP
ncbi:peptide ABC transporter substrate-binding protein [Aeoliella sp. SH292]|uniref:peptide ABC transporter substrate-binding protein n=1 Tax=Aeoliella sp. SH292 TaxID=3454464 RepID=UPI003F95B618